jgi:predicted ATPase/DNA-binding CsgD family transcriptional regulator
MQPLTSFVGRERELAELERLSQDCRLLALTGPGGSGKTRLAIELVARLGPAYPDGVHLVSLAPLTDPSLIASSIASVLDVQEAPNQPVDVSLERSIGDRQMLLLLLDNFEHLLPGGPLIVQLLTACPKLSVLVTSREVLRLTGEQVYAVPPLTVPDLGLIGTTDSDVIACVSASEAVRLFVDRAQSADAGFRLDPDAALAVAELSVRLDGLPLAIEIAAARSRLLPPRAMVTRMERRLPLLTGGPRDLPARQRTLRDTIAWSYDLLDNREQYLFRTLSVFAGGCTLAAIEAVSGAQPGLLDDLASLVDKSLVRRADGPDSEPRLMMLETLREFGAEQLEARQETVAVRDRHALYYLEFGERARARLRGPDAVRWLEHLDAEHDNLRAAIDWGKDRAALPILAEQEYASLSGIELASRIALALTWYWAFRCLMRQAREWNDRLLAIAQPNTSAHARLLTMKLIVTSFMNDLAAARRVGDACLEAWRALGDRYQYALACERLAHAEAYMGDPERAVALLAEMEAASDDPRLAADLEHPPILTRAAAAKQAGDYDTAVPLFEQTLSMARADGDLHTQQMALRPLGIIAGQRGDLVRSQQLLVESVRVCHQLGDALCGRGSVVFVAFAAADAGQAVRATRLLALLTKLWERDGHRNMGLVGVEASLDRARADLGDEAFNIAWDEGRAMTWEQGVAYAVATEDEPPREATNAAGPVRTLPALTPRESEVARLIARGLTNRQIADELVISERTAHSHVYRLLGKLGLRSRTQVAAWVFSQEAAGRDATGGG